MIAEVDCNGDGIIDFCEFLKMMSRHSNPGVDPEQQLAEVFRLFDKDRSGYITQVSVRERWREGGVYHPGQCEREMERGGGGISPRSV